MVEAADCLVMEVVSVGAGAARPPVATVGVQAVFIECWLEQFPEQEHWAKEAAGDSSCDACSVDGAR